MLASRLERAIQHYEATLYPLKSDPPIRLSATQVLSILTARDEVQASLQDTSQTTGAHLEKVYQLDCLLKRQSEAISQIRGAGKYYATWQESFNPSERSWWWKLVAPKLGWSENFDWLWKASSIASLTISLGLLTDMASKFFSGGTDTVGALTISVQTVLTLLTAGGVLTKAGQETLQQTATRLRLPKLHWYKVGAGFAALTLFSLIGLQLSLSHFSSLYSSWGHHDYRKGDWSSAEQHYKRAIHLNANNADAHFRLGRLYEDLQNSDAARAEYRLALQGNKPLTYNNLARLSILKKDYAIAVSLLLKGLESARSQPADSEIRYLMLKNLGWARLEQKDYAEAKVQLESAIDLRNRELKDRLEENIAAPHCLLAQVLQAQGSKEQAKSEWETCLGNANRGNPDEDAWVLKANQFLNTKEVKK
ncbi:MAG: tetratricopeptide repeat protein [Leptolyngbya sp. Prado105]|jgi:tetratricopeptide (TPR) repeat protein|nr:tetratricopeptide repeat protein [Leptolyngbya sp. Prado105]